MTNGSVSPRAPPHRTLPASLNPNGIKLNKILLLGYDRIVEAILSHDDFKVEDRLTISPAEQRRRSLDSDFYTYDGAETRFSPDITPIILASQCQGFDHKI